MKNTIKFLSGAVLVLGLAAVGQVKASTISTSANYVPINISASLVSELSATNSSNVVTFSALKGTLNNAFILSEFYASDDARGLTVWPAIAPAAGDTLAVVVNRPYTKTVYKTLVNGRVVIATNSVAIRDLWNNFEPNPGDIVILNAKGQLKADISASGNADNYIDWTWYYGSYEDWSTGGSYWDEWTLQSYNRAANIYTRTFQAHSHFEFYFPFYASTNGLENIKLQLWGGGSWSQQKNNIVGDALFQGSATVYIQNPAKQTAGSQNIYIGAATVTIPSIVEWYWWNWD